MHITELKRRARQASHNRRRASAERMARRVTQSAYKAIQLRNAVLENDLAATRKALAWLGWFAAPFIRIARLFA